LIALNLAMLSLSLLVSLLLAEGAVRLLAPQQLVRVRPDIWMPADTLGWVHRPNLNTSINTGEGSVRIFTDHEGYRVGAGGRVEAPRSVLILGDSYMAAMQVEYEESIPGLLEARLAGQGIPVSIRNTGVSSWDPPHYLLRARDALARERFDHVLVFLYLGNDIVRSRTEYFRPREPIPAHPLRLPRRATRAEVIDALMYPINNFLEERSHLFILLKNRLKLLMMRAGLTARADPVELRVSEATSSRWDVTADICADIAAEAANHDVSVMFILLPSAYQVDRAEFEDYLRGFGIDETLLDIDQPNRLMLEKLSERGLEVLDATEALRAAHAAGVRTHGRVDPHFNSAGHAIVAELVEPLLVDRLAASGTSAR
jgi:lysophospholipase L1-like esterase